MASTAELAVAKASLSATLFRADPTPCSRDDIDHFFSLLNSAIAQCSPANVQKCKQWTLVNLVPSNARIAPLGKYLCALANSFTPGKERKPEPSVRRKRLHILYILNDIFYHAKFRDHNDNFADKAEGFMPALIRSAAAFPNCPKHAKKIQDLITLWEENGYFNPLSMTKLRAAVEQALVPEKTEPANGTKTADATTGKAGREAPFIMPAMHGDPTMPWYDLPAGNWLPVLEPNSTRPMKPSMIKPLQLAPGPADKALVEAVNKLLVDVDRLYSRQPGQAIDGSYDIDQMGEIVETDELNGDIINGETYYGWSRAFCEKMKARRKKARPGGDSDDKRMSSRSYSRSSDGRSRSRSPRFRHRAQDSRSRSRSRSSSRPAMKRRRSLSDSRSPPRRMQRDQSRSRSRSGSRSRGWNSRRSISRSPTRSRSRSPRRSPNFSPEYSPEPPRQPNNNGNGLHTAGYNNTPPFNQPPFPPQPPHPPQITSYGGFQQQYTPHFAAPPPPPPNYSSQWPPPPPPPHQQNFAPQQNFPPQQNFFHPGAPPQVGITAPAWSGGWPVPPPPPGVGMMPQQAQQQQQYQQQQQQQYAQHNPQNQYGYGRGGGGGFQGGRGGGQWRGGWS